MNVFKGFTDEEVRELARAAERAKAENNKLSAVFENFAKEHGRAKGSVRNFYYEFLHACEADESLSRKYFKNRPAVIRAKAFGEDETETLVKEILKGRENNKSVRRIIAELAGGDEKLSLRYQNKYRNVLRKQPARLAGFAGESAAFGEKKPLGQIRISDVAMKRLKTSIDELVANIARSAKEENGDLKRRVTALERENALLKTMLKSYQAGQGKPLFPGGDAAVN